MLSEHSPWLWTNFNVNFWSVLLRNCQAKILSLTHLDLEIFDIDYIQFLSAIKGIDVPFKTKVNAINHADV